MNATIEKALADQQQVTNWVLALEPHADAAERIAAALPDLRLSVDIVFWYRLQDDIFVNIRYETTTRNPPLDEQTAPILAALKEAGYEKRSAHDNLEIGRRTYDCGPIKVMAFLR
jgi:hypothetical protein